MALETITWGCRQVTMQTNKPTNQDASVSSRRLFITQHHTITLHTCDAISDSFQFWQTGYELTVIRYHDVVVQLPVQQKTHRHLDFHHSARYDYKFLQSEVHIWICITYN